MRARMRAYAHACAHACAHAFGCQGMLVRMYAGKCMSARTHACKHTRRHACTHVCRHACNSACRHATRYTCSHVCMHVCRTVCGQTCTHARRHACQHPCRHGHAPNTTQQSERPLDACVCCNLHMCVLGAPVKSSKAHTPPPAPLGTAQPQMYKRVLYAVGPHAGSEAPCAICNRRAPDA